MAIISCDNKGLPLSEDVIVNVTKAEAVLELDLTTQAFVQSTGTFLHGATRIALYETIEEANADTRLNQSARDALSTFFSQQFRPRKIAVGQAFSAAQAGYAVGGASGALAAFTSITDGEFKITIDGVDHDITALNFSTETDMDGVATVITTALNVASAGSKCEIFFGSDGAGTGSIVFFITSGTTGATSTVSALSQLAAPVGTYIGGSALLNMEAAQATITDGYTPTDLKGELTLIKEAASCLDTFIYGWTIDKSYRLNTADMQLASEWAETEDLAVMFLTYNGIDATISGATTDINSILEPAAPTKTVSSYNATVDAYPDVAALSIMQSVNYAAANSTLTAKFKDLITVPTVSITTTELAVLRAKRYNVFTRVGLNIRANREGVAINTSWFIDERIDLDNFKKDLQENVYSVFVRNGKVPLTTEGQLLIYEAIHEICDRYVLNGAFGTRDVVDTTQKSGVRTDPPFTIIPTPLANLTPTDRANRIGPPFQVIVRLAGAQHEITINVNAI